MPLSRDGKLAAFALLVSLYGLVVIVLAFMAGAFDLRFHYTPEAVYLALEAMGPAGRHLYRIVGSIDLVFIPLYCVLLVWFSNRLARGAWRLVLMPLALVAGLYDLVETGTMYYVLHTYPEPHESLLRFAAIGTSLKWISLGVWGLVTGLILLLNRGPKPPYRPKIML